MRSALLPGMLMALTPWVCAAEDDVLRVTSVRFWSLDGMTRVAVETTGEFRYRAERLTNPGRLFFDLRGAKPAGGFGKGQHTIAVDDPRVQRIRVAETLPGMTRVVLDLGADVDYTASTLRKPDRLVIELRSKTATVEPGPAVTVSQTLHETGKSAPRVFTPPQQKAPVAAAAPVEIDPPALRAPPMAPMNAKPATLAKLDPPKTVVAPGPEPVVRAARRTTDGSRTMARALGLKVGRIVLDAGHGGHDLGSTGITGLDEKDLVLDVTLRLGALLEERLGVDVTYTRNDDTFIALEDRPQIANQKKADLFVSVHANSSPFHSVAGIETYYLSHSTSREALDLAARENATSRMGMHDLQDLVRKIALNDKLVESREFAQKMQTSMFTFASRANPGVRNRGVKRAPFIVLIGAAMPSVLCEIGFVSNTREEALLKKPDHRQKLAESLYRGVERYAATLSQFQVAKKTAGLPTPD